MGGINVGVAKQKGVISLGHSQSLKIYPFISFYCLSLGMFSVLSFQLLGPIKWKLHIEGDAKVGGMLCIF